MSNQNAKFFCENCSAEVPQNARMCRHCGRFFSSVRCPVCGMTGPSTKFSNGCTSCGYAISNGNKVIPPKNTEKTASRKSRRELMNSIDSRYNEFGGKKKRRGDETLPGWVFVMLFFGAAIVLFLAVKYLLKI